MSQVLIELNENIGPLFRGDPMRIKRVSLSDLSDCVDVVDISNLPDLQLIQLTPELRDIIEFHEDSINGSPEDYVGGILCINHVYLKTNVIGRFQTAVTYYKRVKISSLSSPKDLIRDGEVFLASIEYPQLASNADFGSIERRFYHEGNETLQYMYHAFLRKYGDTLRNSDTFRHNQKEILLRNAARIRAMNLFENRTVYPEEVVEQLEEAMTEQGNNALADVIGATESGDDELNTAIIYDSDEDNVSNEEDKEEDERAFMYEDDVTVSSIEDHNDDEDVSGDDFFDGVF